MGEGKPNRGRPTRPAQRLEIDRAQFFILLHARDVSVWRCCCGARRAASSASS